MAMDKAFRALNAKLDRIAETLGIDTQTEDWNSPIGPQRVNWNSAPAPQEGTNLPRPSDPGSTGATAGLTGEEKKTAVVAEGKDVKKN